MLTCTMKIDASLRDLWTPTDEGWQVDLPTGWMQGRSAFGGLTAAAMAALGRRIAPDSSRRLRTMSVQLLSPVRAGPTHGEANILRQGRNITFVEVRLRQRGTLVARSTLVFSRPLESTLDVSAPHRPNLPAPDMFARLPYAKDVTPEFTQHIDMRWAEGHPPFTGATEASYTGLFRYHVPLADDEGVLALLDTWPAPALSMAKTPVPASTVTWTAHLLEPPASFDAWFTFRYETLVGHDGLHTVQGSLYDEAGTLVGWTEQLVAVFG